MIEERDHELIERFLLDEVSAEERRSVEERESVDPEFRDALADMRQVMEAVRLHYHDELLTMFRQWDGELDARAGSIPPAAGRGRWRSRFMWISLAILALTAGFLWRQCHRKEAAPSSPQPASREVLPGPPMQDSFPLKPVEKEKQPVQPEMARSKPDRQTARLSDQQLFAEYYTPYKDALLNPEVRGVEPVDPLTRFQLAYWDGDYAGAVALFASFPADLPVSENDRFCYAGALLATGRTAESIPVFEAIIEQHKSMYVYEAMYGLALARLRSGQRSEAIGLLRRYVAEPRARRIVQANALLEHLR